MRAHADESPELARLEHWFQGEIARPHERPAARGTGAARTARPAPAHAVILPSRHLRPRERVAIYARMYFLRLHECLREDHPALVRVCGDEGFERLTRAYLRAHPSRHYSLNVLGRNLPGFLAGPVRVPRKRLLADLARLEQAMSEVFDERESEVMSPADFAALPPSVWEDARPRLIPALRVHAFDHAVNAIVTAVRQEQSLPPLGRKRTWVAVYRKDDVVWRMDLSEPMYAVLRALREEQSLRAALEAGAAVFRGTPAQLEQQVSAWFAEWVGEGFFRAVE